MQRKTKNIIASFGFVVSLIVAFIAFSNKLFIGPSNADGYIINNNPYNKWIRYLASAISFYLLWYLLNRLIKDKTLALITVCFLVPDLNLKTSRNFT